MTQPDPTPQPKPGYREATADPTSVLVASRTIFFTSSMMTCTWC
ncbi:MAG: hypothetical protein K0S88_7036 [Actinomycetia bacterium]|nr:hypothetical protein [Actinomycetes bacterium]